MKYGPAQTLSILAMPSGTRWDDDDDYLNIIFSMAEKHQLTIEVLAPTNIESEVPRQQNLREPVVEDVPESNGTEVENVSDGRLVVKEGDTVETYVPVLTVKTEESNFGKDGLRFQRVTVTEDVSVNFQHLFKKETKGGKTVVTQMQRFEYKY